LVVKLPGIKTDIRRLEPTVDASELVEKIILFVLPSYLINRKPTSWLTFRLSEKKEPSVPTKYQTPKATQILPGRLLSNYCAINCIDRSGILGFINRNHTGGMSEMRIEPG